MTISVLIKACLVKYTEGKDGPNNSGFTAILPERGRLSPSIYGVLEKVSDLQEQKDIYACPWVIHCITSVHLSNG